jgi:hypothetical protein
MSEVEKAWIGLSLEFERVPGAIEETLAADVDKKWVYRRMTKRRPKPAS